MTALEIRLIAYAIAAIVLLGGAGFIGYRVTANHYETLIARDRAAQDKALQDAKDQFIAAQQAQQSATRESEQKYVDLKNQYDALGSHLADSVRQYATLRSGIVSATSTAATAADAASQSAQRTSELASLVRQAVDAIADDSAQCAALQQWAGSLGGTPTASAH